MAHVICFQSLSNLCIHIPVHCRHGGSEVNGIFCLFMLGGMGRCGVGWDVLEWVGVVLGGMCWSG